MRLSRWSDVVIRWPARVVAVVLAVGLASAAWGSGVLSQLSEGGHADSTSPAAWVENIVGHDFGYREPDVIVIYTPHRGASLTSVAPLVRARLARVDRRLLAKPIESYWSAPAQAGSAFRSGDGRSALALVTLKGSEDQQLRAYRTLAPQLRVPGVPSYITGYSPLADAYSNIVAEGLRTAELVSFPLTLVLLVLIFGGLVSASVPVAVGGLATAGTLGVLRLISQFTEVSQLAMSITTMLGLGLAIDYSLLIVGRFREELATSPDTREAVRNTMHSAGRTVSFSAMLFVVALSGLFLFPQPVMRSYGFAAVSAVVIAATVALSAVPAALALLGLRINAISWRRDAAARSEARALRFWGGMADRVMRRPLAFAVPIALVLVVMALPLLGAHLAESDYTGLPADNQARLAYQQLLDQFPGAGDGATLVLAGRGGQPPSGGAVGEVVDAAQAVGGVLAVSPLGSRGSIVALHVRIAGGDRTAAARRIVTALEGLHAPTGTTLAVGGQTALADAGTKSVVARLPLMLAMMGAVTLILSFLAFGSIVLAIKAVAVSALSLSATFGILTWVFVDGHGASALGAVPGPMLPAMVVMAIAVIFGLSTDYELFLVSRMSEARRSGMSSEDALRTGVARTGRIVTAAAFFLSVVIGAFGLSDLTITRFLCFGLVAGLIIDATLVRMLLVPALVKLMGDVNWWLPAPLARFDAALRAKQATVVR